MYKQALDSLLRDNSLPKSIMLYGESEYLRSIYLDKISSVYADKEDELRFYFDEYDFGSAKTFVSQSSLFGNKNLLIIKSEKAIPKKELEAIIKSCQKNSNSFFVFEYFGTSAKAKDISKVFAKKYSADFVRFFKPSRYEAITYLQNIANNKKLNINTLAIEYLYNLQNENIALCVKELEKLSILEKNISTNDIENYSFGLGIVSLDTLIEKFIKKKDITVIIQELDEIVNSNEIFIINAIENYLTTLFKFHIYIKSFGHFNAKDIVGYPLPPLLAKQKAELSIKINLQTYQKLFSELLKIELILKKSVHIDKNAFFVSSLIKLQSFL